MRHCTAFWGIYARDGHIMVRVYVPLLFFASAGILIRPIFSSIFMSYHPAILPSSTTIFIFLV
jgi:hypothetical protein